MSEHSFPPIANLIPHASGMLLLDRVLAHDATHTVCSASAARSRLFANADGSVPAWVGIECMAQCAAAHGGLATRRRGGSPRPGLLLGSRRVALRCGSFAPTELLEVTARHHRGETGLVAFDCSIRSASDRETLVEGRVNLYLFDDWSEFGEVRR